MTVGDDTLKGNGTQEDGNVDKPQPCHYNVKLKSFSGTRPLR